jgi:hypothetical protein
MILDYVEKLQKNAIEAKESESKAPATVDADRPTSTARASKTTGRNHPRRTRKLHPVTLGASSSPAPEYWPNDSPTQDVHAGFFPSPLSRDAADTASPGEDPGTSVNRYIERFIASYTTSFKAFQQNPQAQASSQSHLQISPEAMSELVATIDRLMAQLRSSQQEATGATPSASGTNQGDE